MDEAVLRSMAKWPDVPAVYGWLSLDRRGEWRIRGERIGNEAVREFIGRNYARDERGCWYFQNGPQRVFVRLAYTPWIVHWEPAGLRDQCGALFAPTATFVDEEGSLLMEGRQGIALLDDRDLGRYAEQAEHFPRIRVEEVPERYGFVADPAPGSGPF